MTDDERAPQQLQQAANADVRIGREHGPATGLKSPIVTVADLMHAATPRSTPPAGPLACPSCRTHPIQTP
jgi:hypothetical protein